MLRRCLFIVLVLLFFASTLNGQTQEPASGTRVRKQAGRAKVPAEGAAADPAPQSLIGPRNSSVRVNPVAQSESAPMSVVQQSGGGNIEDCLRESRSMIETLSGLQRLSERLTAVQTLSQEQTRRLEALDYRLTRLEVQEQERAESLRSLVGDMARSSQQLSWQNGQIVSALETLRQGQDEHRHALAVLSTQQPAETKVSVKGSEIWQKLHSLTNAVHGARVAIAALTEQTTITNKNISTVANMTRDLARSQSNLLTRQAFTSSISELRNNPATNVVMMQQPKSPAIPEAALPTDCEAIKKEGRYKKSGIYRVQPLANVRPFFVFCELNDRGGGWTVIQNRYEGSVNFYRDWLDYKNGFGNIGGEFWLGLQKIHLLTNDRVNELVIELQDFSNEKSFAHYSAFAVGSEVEGYPLTFLAGYDGDAGDSLSYHAGMKFSTRDFDNDQWQDGNCAETHSGAWWYNGCDTSNLNGLYLNGELPEIHEYKGMYWYDWHGPTYSLMSAKMMIRPKAPESLEGLGANRSNATITKPKEDHSKAKDLRD